MQTIPRIALDIDGVFANFNRGFIELLNGIRPHTMAVVPETYAPPMWNYPTEDLNCTDAEMEEVARHIAESGSWWRKLRPYEGAIECLTTINGMLQRQEIDATFITTRRGSAANVRFQTIQWLSAMGITQPQVVVVLDSKTPTICALDIDAILDDRPSNLEAPVRHAALFNQPWNQDAQLQQAIRLHDYGAVIGWLASLPRHPFPAT